MTYGTIIADPPWRYKNWRSAVHGAAARQYELMGQSDLLALGDWVRSVAAPDAVMLLWATWPKLSEAMEILGGWGFKYRTGIPWIKTTPSTGKVRRGIGFWFMSTSEMVLVGVRGKATSGRTGAIGLLCGTEREFYAPCTGHSRKPDGLHAYAEEHLPGPRMEMFARRERPGWRCFGSDLGWLLTPDGPEACDPTDHVVDAPVVRSKAQLGLFGEGAH